jgi:hypothetical protein
MLQSTLIRIVMKRFLSAAVALFLVACSPAPLSATARPANSSTPPFTDTPSVTANPKDQTVTAIMATKFAMRTEAALAEAALPTETPTPPVPPQTPPCRPGGLKAKPYGSMGAGGTIEMGGGITNISASACYLQTWPVFSLVNKAGKPLDIRYESGDERYGYLLLSPGQSAGFSFAWGNWCEPEVAGGVYIRLILADHAGSIDIPPGGVNSPVYGGGHCADPGSKSFIFSISSFGIETAQP